MPSHLEIRHKFTDFFVKRGHVSVPSSSLLPDDPSVLFTTAGMQQFKKYYTGEADAKRDFGTVNTVSIQKSMRTSDIDEVGDPSHLTFFEMLGNFSFGGYFKKEAIEYAHKFLTKELELEIDYVSVFAGDGETSADNESEEIWKSIDPNIEIKKMGREDNFWGPTGNEGPCGPTTEIYINGVEVWNLVFNQYYCEKNGSLTTLKTPGIDTGMGLERLAMVVQEKQNIFETDLLEPIVKLAPPGLEERVKRIIADHSRAIAFLIVDSVRPSNKEQGYVLRRLMRRIITHNFTAKADLTLTHDIFAKIVEIYGSSYPELDAGLIIFEFDKEKEKFEKTLRQGLRELGRSEIIDASAAFRLYESFGLPYEVIKEFAGQKAAGLGREGFDEEFKKHQQISRAGQEKKFGGHGLVLDTGELKAANEEEVKIVMRLHTTTHLLHAALRKILGNEVKQAGSDITAERLRFDFTFPRKLAGDEIKRVEDLVNQVIIQDLEVTKQEMPYEEAIKTGALSFFRLKYPPAVNVYSVGDFSKELCGGPHVKRTFEIGKFKIIKEEAVSAGVRRIRAAVE